MPDWRDALAQVKAELDAEARADPGWIPVVESGAISDRTCRRKAQYGTANLAVRGAKRIMRKADLELAMDEGLAVYPCRTCGNWHIGRRRKFGDA